MQRWCSRLRSITALRPTPTRPLLHSGRLLHSSPNLLNKTFTLPVISSNINRIFNASSTAQLALSDHAPSLPQSSLIQVRHLTLKQRKRKLKSRKPATPVVSKVKKIKMKSYSSYKGRFRVMKDGQIRRWKEGKRHNAHLKLVLYRWPEIEKQNRLGLPQFSNHLVGNSIVGKLSAFKSKKSKRRLRQPGIVPLAYAKVMKKLNFNFCG